MLWVILGTAAAAAAALGVYVLRERLGVRGALLGLCRTAAVAALLLLLVNATRVRRERDGPATVLLDASLSMASAGGSWRAALDTARALAGDRGSLLRFGAEPRPLDDGVPDAGRSLAAPALRAVASRRGVAYLVTDGELDDAATIPDAALAGVVAVVLPRAPVPDAALRDVSLPRTIAADDTLELRLQITTSGPLTDSTATIEITSGGRVLARRTVGVPRPPGAGVRTVTVSPGALAPGTHVLDVRLTVAGDAEPRDDARRRVVTVGALPDVVLIARPPDWESRFLARELADVTGSAVRAFAEVAPGRWIDMRSSRVVPEARVAEAARAAALVVGRGGPRLMGAARARWHWPGGDGAITGDWYPAAPVPASPLAARLAGVEWDSVPPIAGVLPYAPPDDAWVGLAGRLARRGAERPLLLGRDSAGVRILTTTGEGLWRWALRGGAAREAYRALLAVGVDWLLATGRARGGARLTAVDAVPRGIPAVFRWRGDTIPDAPVTVVLDGPDSARTVRLAFDAEGAAQLPLAPGVYRWRAPDVAGAAGVTVVEEYSEEFVARPVQVPQGAAWEGFARRVGARETWWVFAVALGALFLEWAWRIRRGLP